MLQDVYPNPSVSRIVLVNWPT